MPSELLGYADHREHSRNGLSPMQDCSWCSLLVKSAANFGSNHTGREPPWLWNVPDDDTSD